MPLADWSGRYESLRQVTAQDVTDVVAQVKGARAHERAVALRSLFRALKRRRIVFHDPTRRVHITRTEQIPVPLPAERLAGLLDRTDKPAVRLALALVALHALNGAELTRLRLADLDLPKARLTVRRTAGPRTVHLDPATLSLVHAWLRYRHARWPRTPSPFLLVTQQSASSGAAVAACTLNDEVALLDVRVSTLRMDRILDEARHSEDPVHLMRVFGISANTAMK